MSSDGNNAIIYDKNYFETSNFAIFNYIRSIFLTYLKYYNFISLVKDYNYKGVHHLLFTPEKKINKKKSK